MVSGFADRGLWPKLTLSLSDKEVTISLRNEYLNIGSAHDKIRLTLLHLIGKAKNIKFDKNSDYVLNYVIQNIFDKIRTRINWSARSKRSVVKARNQLSRRHMLTCIRNSLIEEIRSNKIKFNEIRGYEIAKIWNNLMKETAIKEVQDS